MSVKETVVDINAMMNFKPGEYMRKMLIQTAKQATREKIRVEPRGTSNQKVIGSTTVGRTRIFVPSRLCHPLNKHLSENTPPIDISVLAVCRKFVT